MIDQRTRISVFDYTLYLVGWAMLTFVGAMKIYLSADTWHFVEGCLFVVIGLVLMVQTFRHHRF